jgi:DNA-damage-inducible protein J
MMHIRVDEDIKTQATQTLDVLGLSVSEAVRLFLKRVVVEEGLPFALKVPSARTRAAIAEAENMIDPRFSNLGDLVDAIEEEGSIQKKSQPSKKK